MTFALPWLLLLLLLLPLAAWLRARRGRPPAFLYSSVQLVRGVTGIRRSHAGVILRRLRWFVIALGVLALSQPRVGEGETHVTASGIDIVVAFDLSTSMKSEDFLLDGERVNRLEIARRVLHDFIDKRPADRIGLVAFARHPYVAAPLTLDHEFLAANLDRLTFASPEEDGTAIGSGLAAAVNRLRNLPSKSKIVILMTDGQNNAGKVLPPTAAEVAASLHIKTYTIGVGTRGTAPFPYIDDLGTKRYTRVPVDIDENTLKAIATKTGGKYFRADRTESLRAIYDEIDRLEKTEVQVKKYQRYRELFPWLLVPALFLVLLELILAHTTWRTLP